MKRVAVVAALLTAGCTAQDTHIPPATSTTVTPVATTTTAPVQVSVPATSTTTSTVPPADPIVLEGQCSQWLGDAVDVGWPVEEIETIDYLIHRESRCEADAFNPDDPRGGSIGLMQINMHWCKPNPSYDIMVGWLQEEGVMSECGDLYQPEVNLKAALVIWLEYGYEPWGMN